MKLCRNIQLYFSPVAVVSGRDEKCEWMTWNFLLHYESLSLWDWVRKCSCLVLLNVIIWTESDQSECRLSVAKVSSWQHGCSIASMRDLQDWGQKMTLDSKWWRFAVPLIWSSESRVFTVMWKQRAHLGELWNPDTLFGSWLHCLTVNHTRWQQSFYFYLTNIQHQTNCPTCQPFFQLTSE